MNICRHPRWKPGHMVAIAIAACAWALCSARAAAPPAPLNDSAEGQKLAREMLSVHPTEDIEFVGVMKISRPEAGEKSLSIRTRVVLVSDTAWKTEYEARVESGGVESLTILHTRGRPPSFALRRGDSVDATVETNSAASFAGSDFTLFDLGLGFVHWPTQMLYTRQMRKGLGCDVLESRPAGTNLYSSVRSWIAQESRAQGQPGVVMAEAYDQQGRLLKEFEVNGFKKGQVTSMELRNRQSKSRTRLLFDPDPR